MQVSRRQVLALGACCGAGAILPSMTGCRTAPMTGRHQLVLVPQQQEIQLGDQAYRELLASEPPSSNQFSIEVVNRVGNRIAGVAEQDDFNWEFNVIESPTQNAFCLPGGKVGIYQGMLPVCENEAGLAVVMAHEVAHAIARHGGERMSQNYVVDGVKNVVGRITSSKVPERHEQLMQAYGMATKLGVLLPYSRHQESEADHIGIMLMAQAGYDPREAPRFWQRFSTMGQGQKPPQFLSTHPADETRAKDLLALMDEAMGHYSQTTNKHGLGQSLIRQQTG